LFTNGLYAASIKHIRVRRAKVQSDTRSGSPVLREFVRASQIGARTRPIKLRRARVPVWREFIVRADEKLTAFVELERVIYEVAVDLIS
jgi:hypothetical protein